MRSHNKKFLSKASKIFGGDNKIFNLEVPHLCFARILLKPYMCWLLFIFLDREFHPKCLQW